MMPPEEDLRAVQTRAEALAATTTELERQVLSWPALPESVPLNAILEPLRVAKAEVHRMAEDISRPLEEARRAGTLLELVAQPQSRQTARELHAHLELAEARVAPLLRAVTTLEEQLAALTGGRKSAPEAVAPADDLRVVRNRLEELCAACDALHARIDRLPTIPEALQPEELHAQIRPLRQALAETQQGVVARLEEARRGGVLMELIMNPESQEAARKCHAFLDNANSVLRPFAECLDRLEEAVADTGA